jgi:hypothetical protein
MLEWLVLYCPPLLSSSCRTAKGLEVAGWFSQYSLSLLCFAFVTVSLFRDLFRLCEALAQFLLHFGRDRNALA